MKPRKGTFLFVFNCTCDIDGNELTLVKKQLAVGRGYIDLRPSDSTSNALSY